MDTSTSTSRSLLRQAQSRQISSSAQENSTQDERELTADEDGVQQALANPTRSPSNGPESQLSARESSNEVETAISAINPLPLVPNSEETPHESLERATLNRSTQTREVIVPRRSQRIAAKLKKTFLILKQRMYRLWGCLISHLVLDQNGILQDRLKQLLLKLAVLNRDARKEGRQAKYSYNPNTHVKGQLPAGYNVFNTCLVCYSRLIFKAMSLYPTTTIQQNKIDDICTVCRSVYQSGDAVLKMYKCKHKFHVNCIKRWIRQPKSNCPNCRTYIGLQLFLFCRVDSTQFQLLDAEFQNCRHI